MENLYACWRLLHMVPIGAAGRFIELSGGGRSLRNPRFPQASLDSIPHNSRHSLPAKDSGLSKACGSRRPASSLEWPRTSGNSIGEPLRNSLAAPRPQ
jgi:hypothetical protein